MSQTTSISGVARKIPDISIVIATYNRRALLELALAALDKQSLACDRFEVIVVDDGSTDDTSAWLAEQAFSFSCIKVQQTNQGPSKARNAGVNIARGEVVLFLDDDLIAEPELVAEHLRLHENSTANVVLGPASSLPYYKQPWIVWQQDVMDKTYHSIEHGDLKPTFRHFWSGNCSLPLSKFNETGGFNASFLVNEDVELGYKLMERGLNFIFNPAAGGYHHSSRSFKGWANAHATYGRTNVEILRRSGKAELYRELREDWQARHPLTRLLAGWASGGRFRFQMVVKGLSALVQLGRIAPMSRFPRMTCSALANVLYWDGVHRALGDDWRFVTGSDDNYTLGNT